MNNTLQPQQQQQAQKMEIIYKAGAEEIQLSPEVVKAYLVSGDPQAVTMEECIMFMRLCKYQHLNPFLKEAYLIKYGSQPATIVTGKAAFEKRAANCEKYRGFSAGVIVATQQGEITRRQGTLVLSNEALLGGWAEVYVDGYEKPVTAEVSFQEYAGRKKDGTLNSQWASKPATMVRKVAKVQALREAFPEDFAGLYISEELTAGNEDLPEISVPAYNDAMQQPQQPQQSGDDFADIMGG